MREPTDRQLATIAAIRAYRLEHGYSPSYREIAELLGCAPGSVNWVADLVRACERKGLVTRAPRVARSVQVTDDGAAALAAAAEAGAC